MKRVSPKVAQVLKEAEYPQDCHMSYTSSGELVSWNSHHVHDGAILFAAPTYLEAWLWLWREKGVWIELLNFSGGFYVNINQKPQSGVLFNDPEEAIIATIEYLCDNNLIK